MNIDAIITKWIFDRNKDRHEFYIEESYVIDWMFPYLEPHGLILKVNKEPQRHLEPTVIVRDRDYWDKLTKTLVADPHFRGNEMARKTYSKMRSAIGGVYTYRKLYEDAVYALHQSVELCPDSPEANYRLAQFFLETGRPEEAVVILEAYQKLDPRNNKIELAINQIRGMKQAGASIKQLEQQLATQPHNLQLVEELAKHSLRVQQFGRVQTVFDSFLAHPDVTAMEMLGVGQFYLGVNQTQLAVRVVEQATLRFPDAADPFYALAVIQVARGSTNEALTALRHAIEIFPAFRERVRNDQQFAPLRTDPRFQSLITIPVPVKESMK